MSTWLIIIVTILYFSICVSFIFEKNYPMAMVWGGYAFANIGLLIVAMAGTGGV